MSVVDVELFVVPDCPNESVALSVLCLAFDRVGLAAQSVRTTVMASQEQAQERGFVGSPTILVNGVGPFGAAGAEPDVCLPRLRHPGRTIGCTAVGRRHLRPDRRQPSRAGFARMSCPPGVHR